MSDRATWIDPLTHDVWESELIPESLNVRFHDTGMAIRYPQPETDGWYYARFAGPIGDPKVWFVARYQSKVVRDDSLVWSLYPWTIDGDAHNLRFQRVDLVEWKSIKEMPLRVPLLAAMVPRG